MPPPSSLPGRRVRALTLALGLTMAAGGVAACGSSAPGGTGGDATTSSPAMMTAGQMEQLQKALETGAKVGPLASTSTSSPP